MNSCLHTSSEFTLKIKHDLRDTNMDLVTRKLSKYHTICKILSLGYWNIIKALWGQLPHSTEAHIHKWLSLYSEMTRD